MTTNHYHKTITTSADIETVRAALTRNISKWWTEPDQALVNIGDRAKFSFPPNRSYWSFELTQLSDTKIVLHCFDALHIHDGQPEEIETEWLETTLIFTLKQTQHGNKAVVQIDFTHQGLLPELHCYEICQAGWNFFFAQSLSQYLNTGQGTPHTAPMKA